MINKLISIFLVFLFLITQNFSLTAFASTSNKQQAGQLATSAHKAYETKHYQEAAELYEKAYTLDPQKLYFENSITSYKNQVIALANQEKYEEATAYCTKLLAKHPENKEIKELLCDMYYSKGEKYFYSNKLNEAKADLEKSLELAVVPDQKQRAEEDLSKLKTVMSSGGYISSAQNIDPKDSENIKKAGISVTEQLNELETNVFGKPQDKPLLTRLDSLETKILNAHYPDESIVNRINRLNKTLFPEKASFYSNNDYIPEIISQSGNRISIFGKMPVKIYFNTPAVSPYKRFYKAAVEDGFKEWAAVSNGLISFEYVNSPQDADLQVDWVKTFEDYQWNQGVVVNDLSVEKEKMKYRKAGKMVQMGSMAAMIAGGLIGVPIIGNIGSIGGAVASPYLQYKGLSKDKLAPDIKINTLLTEKMPEDEAKAKIKQIAMHNIGHAIGLCGHSTDPGDIMYENFTATKLSERDINSIRYIYQNRQKKPVLPIKSGF